MNAFKAHSHEVDSNAHRRHIKCEQALSFESVASETIFSYIFDPTPTSSALCPAWCIIRLTPMESIMMCFHNLQITGDSYIHTLVASLTREVQQLVHKLGKIYCKYWFSAQEAVYAHTNHALHNLIQDCECLLHILSSKADQLHQVPRPHRGH